MTFAELLDQALAILQRHGRVTNQTLQLQFQLDDAHLAALKDQLLYAYPQVVDDEGRGLVWMAEQPAPEPEGQRGTEAEIRLHALLPAVIGLLQSQRRLTYRTLKYIFGINDALLGEIRAELTFRRLVIDEDDKGLVWTGEAQSVPPPVVGVPSPPATADTTVVTSPATSILPTTPVEAIISTETLQDEPAVTPPPVRSGPKAERRQLTVMFSDVVDSTKLSGQLDPEDYREVLRAYHSTCAEVIHRFDGYIAQHLGDALLVYFGFPEAHENDAHRGILAGLGMLEAMKTLHTRLEQDKGICLSIRVGLHTGLTVIGDIGEGQKHELLALGEAPNVASRIQGLAEPDTIAISAATHRLVEGYFTVEDLGHHTLKGMAEPQQAYRVLGESTARSRLDLATTRGLTPLVGREQEVGLLLERWEQVKDGQGQVVLLSGEGGIGKSRLVQVLKDHVAAEAHTRLECRSSPYYQNTALYPMTDLLERTLLFQREDAPEAKLNKLEDFLSRYKLPLEETTPLLSPLLSLPLPEDRYPPLHWTPQRQRQKTLESIVAILLEQAEQQPVLFILEDLHWTDPTTLELLDLLIDQTPTASIYALLTCRPHFQLPWQHRSYLTKVTINRLSRNQIERMAEQAAGGKRLPVEVLQQIVDKTDGVPLFVEELTKAVLESGVLKATDGHHELVAPLTSLTIPATLQDSLMARLDRLVSAKGIAQQAAVIGRQFSYKLLHAVSQLDEPTLQKELTRLVEAELVYQRGLLPQATYTFKHALIQDAAYQSLLKSTRQQYHQRIAHVLQGQFPETAETYPELLAHHYTEAGLIAQAIPHWQKAGQSASQRSANAEAISHLMKGLELLKILPDTPEHVQQALTLQLSLGSPLMATKGSAAPEVEQAYIRARELCQQVGDPQQLFPVLQGLRRCYLQRAELETAHELGTQLFTLAQRLEDAAFLLEAHYALGRSLTYAGEFILAREHLEQAITLYNRQRCRSDRLVGAPTVTCLSFVAHVVWYLGYPDQGLQRSHEALAVAHELSLPYRLASVLTWAAWLHLFRREAKAAQVQAEAAMNLSTEQRFPDWLSLGALVRGWALAEQGQGEEGIGQIQEGLTAWRATGAELLRPSFLALLAEAYGKGGYLEDGLRMLDEALAVVRNTGERWWEAEVYRLKGALLLRPVVPDASQAEACFHQALDVARAQQVKSLELRAATCLARLWQQQSKHKEARELLAPVYGWFTEGFDTADLQEAKAVLAELPQ
jgi:predicted ATPase/class 3 adenylate cyclase